MKLSIARELKIIILFVLYLPFCFLAITIYCYLHEFAGHYLANLISGISTRQMEIIWLIEFEHIKIVPLGITPINMETNQFSYFFGGFMSGSLLLVLSILFWKLYSKKLQKHFLWLFAFAASFSLAGFTESVVEGFFLEYHRGTIETVILIFYAIILPLIIILVHYKKHRLIRLLKT